MVLIPGLRRSLKTPEIRGKKIMVGLTFPFGCENVRRVLKKRFFWPAQLVLYDTQDTTARYDVPMANYSAFYIAKMILYVYLWTRQHLVYYILVLIAKSDGWNGGREEDLRAVPVHFWTQLYTTTRYLVHHYCKCKKVQLQIVLLQSNIN